MDIIRVELEEKYIADAEPRDECIAFSVYIKSGDFSGRGAFVYTVNELWIYNIKIDKSLIEIL